MQEPLDISQLKPLGGGTHRMIYEVPGQPDLLLKVMRDTLKKEPKDFFKKLKYAHKERSQRAKFRFLFREYNAYIKAKLAAQNLQCPLPVSEMRGLTVTTQGLGMLVEKVVDRNGNLAPRVTQLKENGTIQNHLEQLNAFVRECFSLNLLANDINRGNVVLGYRNGREQFILIDGLGDSHFLRLRSFSIAYNRRSLGKRFLKMARFCGLHWNPDTLCFEVTRQAVPTAT